MSLLYRSLEKSPREGNDSDIPWEFIRVSCYRCRFREGFLLTVNNSSTLPSNSKWSASNSTFQKFSVLGFWALSKVSPTVTASQKAPGTGLIYLVSSPTCSELHHQSSHRSCRTLATSPPFNDKTMLEKLWSKRLFLHTGDIVHHHDCLGEPYIELYHKHHSDARHFRVLSVLGISFKRNNDMFSLFLTHTLHVQRCSLLCNTLSQKKIWKALSNSERIV